MLKFCDTCNSKLIKTKEGPKCPQCDKQSLQKIKEDVEKTFDTTPRYSAEHDFPFEKNQHCIQKEVRDILGCDKMSGINYNKEGNFLVLFMNAHELKPNPSNPYYDHYVPKTGLYHYSGKGKKGDQTLTGVNGILDKSNETNTDIHFFMQRHFGSNHQYMGKMKLEDTIPTTQPDEESKSRRVYEFLLRPIE